nr:RING finger domain-containing protein [Oceanusvirus sp.]
MHFGKAIKQFSAEHSRLAGCLLDYKSLKRSVRKDSFDDHLKTEMARARKAWNRRATAVITQYRLIGDWAPGIRQRASDVHCAGLLNSVALRKITKKRDKAVPGSSASAAFSTSRFSASQKMTELMAVAGHAPPECPICLEKVANPVAMSCGHPMCGACAERVQGTCPVCRARGHKMGLGCWAKRTSIPRVPGNAAVIRDMWLA